MLILIHATQKHMCAHTHVRPELVVVRQKHGTGKSGPNACIARSQGDRTPEEIEEEMVAILRQECEDKGLSSSMHSYSAS